MMMTKKVLLVDDHPISLDGLVGIVDRAADLETLGKASSARESIALLESATPDLMIIDINLPDRSGLDLIKDVLHLHEGMPVLVISMHEESLFAERALRVGARGYVMKNASPDQILKAMRTVLGGGFYVSEAMSSQFLGQVGSRRVANGSRVESGVELLSDREFEVFHWIGQGTASRGIAEKLAISARTVDSHRTRIKEKLGIANGPELNRYAIQWMESQGSKLD